MSLVFFLFFRKNPAKKKKRKEKKRTTTKRKTTRVRTELFIFLKAAYRDNNFNKKKKRVWNLLNLDWIEFLYLIFFFFFFLSIRAIGSIKFVVVLNKKTERNNNRNGCGHVFKYMSQLRPNRLLSTSRELHLLTSSSSKCSIFGCSSCCTNLYALPISATSLSNYLRSIESNVTSQRCQRSATSNDVTSSCWWSIISIRTTSLHEILQTPTWAKKSSIWTSSATSWSKIYFSCWEWNDEWGQQWGRVR